MTIKEFQERLKEIQEWTEKDWAEVEQNLSRGNMTFKEFRRLFELAQTEEAQEYIHLINQCFLKISSLLEKVELSEAPPQWLLDRIVDGGRIVWNLIHAVPKCLRTTMGDIRLLFSLRHIETPEIILDILFGMALCERCSKEANKRISALSDDVAGAIFLTGKAQTESVEAIVDSARAHTRKLWLPQERGTSEAGIEKDSTLGELLSEQLAQLRELSVEDFFIQAMEKKLDYLPDNIRNGFIDEIRKQSAQKRMPSGNKIYLDAEVSVIELLVAENESLQTQLDVIHTTARKNELAKSQKEKLRKFLSKTDIRILDIIVGKPDATQKEIAEKAECTQSKISKAKRKFQRHKEKIKEILEF